MASTNRLWKGKERAVGRTDKKNTSDRPFVVVTDLFSFVALLEKMKKERLHISTLIIGSILAFAIAFSQFLTPESLASTEKVKTEQTENCPEKETGSYISLPTFSIPVPVHLQSNLNPYYLFEIFQEEDIDENLEEANLLHPDRLFETMFRVIISPNAP
ncbi:MAG: hypothetical protein WEB30_03480 [Cyclobacteriaceae bacterium]